MNLPSMKCFSAPALLAGIRSAVTKQYLLSKNWYITRGELQSRWDFLIFGKASDLYLSWFNMVTFVRMYLYFSEKRRSLTLSYKLHLAISLWNGWRGNDNEIFILFLLDPGNVVQSDSFHFIFAISVFQSRFFLTYDTSVQYPSISNQCLFVKKGLNSGVEEVGWGYHLVYICDRERERETGIKYRMISVYTFCQ